VDAGSRILLGIEERPGAVLLRLDGGETLEIAPDAMPADLPGLGERVGQSLLDVLRGAAARKRAARRLFELLGRRLWPSATLERKLLEEGHSPAAVAAVLAAAAEQGLCSDRGFAEAFCRDMLRTKPVGRAWLAARLRQKGIAADLAAEVANSVLPPEIERDLAERAGAQRWRQLRGGDARARAQLQRFLASRGFPAAVCGDVARRCAGRGAAPDAACNSDPEEAS